MRILFASSEVHPYSKTGGLADMVGALAKALAQSGHEVVVVTPLYRGLRERFPEIQPADWRFDITLAHWRVEGALWMAAPAPDLKIYFVEQGKFFDRAGIYGENNDDYSDNGERFIFFAKCVVNLARHLPTPPAVVHVHDWQAALVPALMQHAVHSEGWPNPPRTCLTIHNLAYQGVFPAGAFAMTNLAPSLFTLDVAEFFGKFNCLKTGIALADVVTTVSPRYAREITTEEFGCGLDGLIRKRREDVRGILNGVDYDEWKTTGNPHLGHDFSVDSLGGKLAVKLELQREVGLSQRPDVPLYGVVSRLADQKGMDLLLTALEGFLNQDIQFILLGSGDKFLENAYVQLSRRFSGKVAVRIGYDQGLSHRIEAGCDFFVMPSRFEPCGLNQMYSLRYGTVPIVRATGGLDDTVVDASESLAQASGIKFVESSVSALAEALQKSLKLYSSPELLAAYRERGMLADHSWKATVGEYLRAYMGLNSRGK